MQATVPRPIANTRPLQLYTLFTPLAPCLVKPYARLGGQVTFCMVLYSCENLAWKACFSRVNRVSSYPLIDLGCNSYTQTQLLNFKIVVGFYFVELRLCYLDARVNSTLMGYDYKTNDHKPPQTTANHHKPPQTTTNHHQNWGR